MTRTRMLFLIALSIVSIAFAVPTAALAQPGYGQQRITCSSNNGKRNWCAIGGARDAQLVRQISGSPCVRGDTWASTTAASGLIEDAVPNSPTADATGQVSRPSPAPPTMAKETGAPLATAAMSSSFARSAARPASAAIPGASTTAASGLIVAAVLTSSSAQATALLRDHHPRKSSPAPPITASETGATLAVVVTSNSTARSADRPVLRARPGESTNAASGSTMAAAPSSASADAT